MTPNSVLLKNKPNWKDLPISDAVRSLNVSIRIDEVKRANRKDPNSCPTALACERMGFDPIIYATTAYLAGKNQITRYKTAKDLRHELRVFDKTGKFTPGLYRLRAPGKRERLGAVHVRGQRSNRRPQRNRKPLTLSIRRFE